MSGFSPEWLALREPADHRSRCTDVADAVRRTFARHASMRVVDLGCGTGSNLRATSALLPVRQIWTLVDYDARLLAAARTSLTAWADRARATDDVLHLEKADRRLEVHFRQADANKDLDGALGPEGTPAADLVTASAFFDLCSRDYMDRFALAVARRKARFYTVLTYNGEQGWTPPHAADAELTAAFHHHQTSDKGFGPAAGPMAARALAEAFRAAGYGVREGDSPWILGASEQRLVTELATGFAAAVEETGEVPVTTVKAWRAVTRTGARVGHTDTLAEPA